jgi:hypothetical protein
MKTLSCLLMAVAACLVGCGEKSTQSPAATNSSASVVTAPVDYLGAMVKAKQYSEKTIDTASLNNALQLFNESEGRYPATLEELVEKHYMPKLPAAPYGMKLVYDAQNGKVSVVNAPPATP